MRLFQLKSWVLGVLGRSVTNCNKNKLTINQDRSWSYDLYHQEEAMFGNLYTFALSNNFQCVQNKMLKRNNQDEFNILYHLMLSYKEACMRLL